MYQHLDSLVVRAAVNPPVDVAERWPDLVGPAATPESWRLWLREVMQNRAFEMALEQASPVLARRVREIRDGRQVPQAGVRRAVLSVMRYRLRASGRATPFGLFAGVAPVRVADHASVRAGVAHRAVARVEAGWLCAVVDRLEADPVVRARLDVVANNLVFERDGHLVLEHRAAGGTDGVPTRVQVRAHAPVRAAMGIGRRSVRFSDLAARLASEFAPVPADVVDRLLADLVAQRFLLTNLRPPMTASDPLRHVVGVLQTTLNGGPVTVEAAWVAERLNGIVDGLRSHDSASSWTVARSSRERLGEDMAEVHPSAEPALRVDLRMDWALAVPRAVAVEAAAAAGVLVRLARRSTLSSGWDAWHGRFLERYGPCALVPVFDAVDPEIGLGYPAGYAGSPAPAGVTFTDRDAKLLALAQNAALRREREIVLDDRMISDLTVVDQDAHVQPTTELTLRVHATSTRSLDDGAFTLAVVGVSRRAGTTTGRLLDLFDAKDSARMRALYAGLPTASRDALSVQISAPARYTNTDTVGRAPQIMAHRLSLGEYDDSEDGDSLPLDDIVVTADVHRIYLLSLSRRQLVEPVALNAVEPVRRAHPLARFLAEAPAALSVPCAPFDWGVAAQLPFLPALRHGRTVLSPARWLLGTADLPGSAAGWTEWDRALASWREQVNLPSAVYLGDGDQRIGLDLSEPAHRVLLRSHLDRSGAALLRAAPDTDAAGWVSGHAHEIVVPLAAVAAPAATPGWFSRAQVVGRDHGHLPGCDARFSVKIYAGLGCQDDILTRHLPHLVHELNGQQAAGEARWWFLRYHDPDDHLRLRLAVTADGVAPTADRIGAWTQRLRRAGLISRAQWDTYFPETSRFGGTAAMDAAEAYFAADSAAALAQLAASREKSGPDRRALTAASMLAIVTGLIGDTAEATSWLISHTRTEPSAPARALYQQTVALANPADPRALAAQPGGEHVLSCWAHRREALTAYRHVLQETRAEAPTSLLPDLLHLHHVRMAGVSLAGERACLHLARAAALSWTARTRNPS
ncbi:hypothetical protein ThrDRAFT_04286 [Frankia casuarinae]|uniref:Lantibiotic dehydratase-like n=1 Tax=Frankia casuarinae (strain DSM 45818 / CECT 9043 / HFP020203 / CcI3) TaxID=106370 RepID=Q2JBD5_FRACC|nr:MULTISPECIES: lantibiotic dehydratase [Frankia]ABD11407.1 Lantibiotic dehydratase-like [Frankia casuarinae]ETA00320.1 hypothetical protein CcI6DRAFT_04261 [Frankia sp. CcI6]EYT90086.1 hypothetical protein ThrDRAFT_04286 [Frankia casuarinae]KDA41277.1 hypothetical protein BMG523Draft_03909 [Frankia sp. BMG5.23]OHV54389.1 lantibiotic dehydratase [Frankia sp. CgIS1]